MKITVTLLLLLSTCLEVLAVKPGGCGCTNCENNANQRQKVSGAQNETAPFNAIAHLYRTKAILGTAVLGTVSFVNNTFLLGSAHYIKAPKLIKSLTLERYNAAGEITRLVLAKGEFTIIPNKQHRRLRNDATVIAVKDPAKLRKFFGSTFSLQDYSQLKPAAESEAHVTGYPCDMGGSLVEKHCSVADLKPTTDGQVIGYPVCTCKGDSGAPLWIEKDGKYYLIGIHHGGGENDPDLKHLNAASLISGNLLQWILDPY